MRSTSTLVWRMVSLTSGASGAARRPGGLGRHLDREHGAAAEVVVHREHAAQELQRFARDGQARADAADDLPLQRAWRW